jgi:polysaccharide deacetylase family protein (PEP-CTERM system associated)
MTDSTDRHDTSRLEPAFALSVDVEDYYQVQAFAKFVPRETWDRHPSRVSANTRRLLDLFDAAGATATFFTLGCVARAEPQLVREIAARGHEVASHGVDHRMITELSPAEFRSQAVESKRRLEDLAGHAVIGYRAPSYSVGAATLWALAILRESGYEYDSSIYPIRRRRYGYPDGPRVPARMAAGTGTIAEFPLPTLAIGPMRIPVLAGAYLRLFPSWFSLRALDAHVASGTPLVVNVHPWELDPSQPTIGPSRRHTWTHYTRLHATEGILARVIRRARFRPVRDRLLELGLLGPPAVEARATPSA